MAKCCDYLVERGSRYYCLLKKSDGGEISDTTYKNYCKYDDMKKCPIYENHEEGR